MAIVLAILLAGCAATDIAKQGQGQGTTRTYEYPYEPVFKTAIAVGEAQNLEVVESDETSGLIVFKNAPTVLSLGERIAVFINRSGSKTTVEVFNVPLIAPLNFPPDWETILHDDIEAVLKSRHGQDQ